MRSSQSPLQQIESISRRRRRGAGVLATVVGCSALVGVWAVRHSGPGGSTAAVPLSGVASPATAIDENRAILPSTEIIEVTRYRIGDAVRTDETLPLGPLDVAFLPKWEAVSRDGVVIGYMAGTPQLLPPDGPLRPGDSVDMQPPIVDENGVRIGAFVNGLPVLDSKLTR